VNPTLLGALAALLSAGGTWYAVQASRRTEKRSATREETQQALDAQDKLLDRYEKRIEKLEDSVKTAVAEAAEAKSHNQSCERRLALIEHMLVDLGGILPPRDHG
jgi:septal ring factor EnvC (AmiA/AmiB activator)